MRAAAYEPYDERRTTATTPRVLPLLTTRRPARRAGGWAVGRRQTTARRPTTPLNKGKTKPVPRRSPDRAVVHARSGHRRARPVPSNRTRYYYFFFPTRSSSILVRRFCSFSGNRPRFSLFFRQRINPPRRVNRRVRESRVECTPVRGVGRCVTSSREIETFSQRHVLRQGGSASIRNGTIQKTFDPKRDLQEGLAAAVLQVHQQQQH